MPRLKFVHEEVAEGAPPRTEEILTRDKDHYDGKFHPFLPKKALFLDAEASRLDLDSVPLLSDGILTGRKPVHSVRR